LAHYAAVLDACVLVPIALADTLLRIAERELYRPLWSGVFADLWTAPHRSVSEPLRPPEPLLLFTHLGVDASACHPSSPIRPTTE